MGICRPEAFCQCIFDSRQFHYRAYASTGDEPGSLRRRLKEDSSGPMLTDNFMGNGSVRQGNLNQGFFRLFDPFANGFGNLVRLPETVAHMSRSIAGNNNSTKTKSPPTFHHFAHTADVDHLLFNFEPFGTDTFNSFRHSLLLKIAIRLRVPLRPPLEHVRDTENRCGRR